MSVRGSYLPPVFRDSSFSLSDNPYPPQTIISRVVQTPSWVFRPPGAPSVDMGVHEKCYILAGVTPMKSVGMAQYMAKSVPGMDVPDSLIKRLREAGKGKVAEEGIQFAVEQIEEFKQMEGVAGVHLMAIEWEHRVPEIAERAGVLPRPKV